MNQILIAGLVLCFTNISAALPARAENEVQSGMSRSDMESFTKTEQAYLHQQSKLQGQLGEDVFVASYKGIVHDDRIVTFAIWTDTVPTALPKTDFIWLQNSTMSKWYVVSWSEFEDAIPLSVLDQEGPIRYLTPSVMPAGFFAGLEKDFEAPAGFPEAIASGQR